MLRDASRNRHERAAAPVGTEEIILSLKHYWRFVDSEALELQALSDRVVGKIA